MIFKKELIGIALILGMVAYVTSNFIVGMDDIKGKDKIILESTFEEITNNDEIMNHLISSTKPLFERSCSGCHSGENNNDVNLADNAWLFGGTLAKIEQSIVEGREGWMPARMMGISDSEASLLATYLIDASKGMPSDSNPEAKRIYEVKACIGCHGRALNGNISLGSADLSDNIFRFKSDNQHASIVKTIIHGINEENDPLTRKSVMPAFGTPGSELLSELEIKKLTLYVHQLGGGVIEE